MPRPNQGPHLRPGRAGRYEIRWTDNGRSYRRSTGTSDLQSAQKVLGNFLLLDQRERAANDDSALMVLDVLGDENIPGHDYWHEHVIPNVIDKDTVRYSYVKLKKHFGHLSVSDISPADVTAYVSARRVGKIGRPSVGHTIARELSVLNAAINHAVKNKRLAKTDQPFIELPPHSPPRDRWLTGEEADRLLAAARAVVDPHAAKDKLPRVFRFVVLALGTAGRRGALLELRRSQVDLENRIIYLNPTGRAQTKKRRAKVPISDDLLPVIERILSEIPDEPEAFLLDHSGSIRRAFDNAVERAGLAGVTPHVLRHTKATWMAQDGVSMFDIAGVLGDTIATVTKTYAHHSPDYLRGAINSRRGAGIGAAL